MLSLVLKKLFFQHDIYTKVHKIILRDYLDHANILVMLRLHNRNIFDNISYFRTLL